MNSTFIRRCASTVLALLLIFYVGYQVYISHHAKIKTETAGYFTASNSVQTTVAAVRKETVLTCKKSGVVNYIVKTGERVAKGGTIAQIYADESQVSAQHELEDVQSEIQQLQDLQSPGSTYSDNPDSLNGQICAKLSDILGVMDSNDLSEAFQSKNDLLNLISEKQILTGKASNFNARISALQAQCRELKAKAGTAKGSVTSPKSGFFIQQADGLESAVDYGSVGSISCDQIKSFINTKKVPAAGSIGKICEDFDWYLVCVVPADQVAGFRQLDTDDPVSVKFPFVSETSVAACVDAINQKGADSEAAVVLKCKNMNSSLAGIRCESAQIITSQYTGLRVSQRSVHFKTVSKKVKNKDGTESTVTKQVQGVYVMHGSQINFRQIVPEYSTDNYVICDPNPDKDSIMTDDTVKLYDEVIVEGTDLYDGKVVQ